MERQRCNNCPYYKIRNVATKYGYKHRITVCTKFEKQLYYLYGEESQTPHVCKECARQFCYVPYL